MMNTANKKSIYIDDREWNVQLSIHLSNESIFIGNIKRALISCFLNCFQLSFFFLFSEVVCTCILIETAIDNRICISIVPFVHIIAKISQSNLWIGLNFCIQLICTWITHIHTKYQAKGSNWMRENKRIPIRGATKRTERHLHGRLLNRINSTSCNHASSSFLLLYSFSPSRCLFSSPHRSLSFTQSEHFPIVSQF